MSGSLPDLITVAVGADDDDHLATVDDDVDDDALRRATTALHLLGSVVWFDDEVLHDLVILSTQWLSDAISTVLTTKHRLVKAGLIDAHSLPLIWKPPQFPARLHTRLVALLSQFELLHPLDASRFLVPSMLPEATTANVNACVQRLPAIQLNAINSLLNRILKQQACWIHHFVWPILPAQSQVFA